VDVLWGAGGAAAGEYAADRAFGGLQSAGAVDGMALFVPGWDERGLVCGEDGERREYGVSGSIGDESGGRGEIPALWGGD